MTEPFALRFELDAMLRLGNTLQDVLFSYAWDGLTYTVVSRTVLGALYAGLWPLGLIKVASVLDNPFSVALARADKAGKVLAHALIDGVQGKRPVTLIGYSVGARVIYACLVELAEQHAFGLIESVVLMGAPTPSDRKQWRQIRSVVTARVVNVYSTEDYVLGYLYRSTKLEMGVAGLAEVQDVHGIESFNASKLVSGHDQYRYLVGTILVKIGLGDLNFNKVAEQERALELAERKKQRIKEEAKEDMAKIKSPSPPQVVKKSSMTIERSAPIGPSLIDVDGKKDTVTRPDARSQVQRPAMYSQSSSRQQPARRGPRPQAHAQNIQRQPTPTESDLASDPLGTTDILEAKPLSVKHTSRPIPSAQQQRQMPSALTSDPTLRTLAPKVPPPMPKRDPTDSEGPIRLVDVSHIENWNRVDKENTKNSSAVTVTEVIFDAGQDDHAAKGEIETIDDSEDDIDSEFGELAMVDPVPLDDFDYGLM